MDEDQGERAMLLLSAGKHDAAMRLIGEALARDPDDGEAWALRTSVHLARGQNQEALHAVREALAAFPDDGEAHALHAQVLVETGEFAEARLASAIAVGLCPEDAWCHSVRAQTLALGIVQGLDGHSAAEVIAMAERALALDSPVSPVVAANVGMALLLVGRRMQAVEILEAAVARHPQSPQLITALGMSRDPAAQPAHAWRLWETANSLDSSALRNTRVPIVLRLMQLVAQYLVLGGALLVTAGVLSWLQLSADWSAVPRLVTGVVVAVLLSPSAIGQLTMPRQTRRFLRDAVPREPLYVWSGGLTAVCGITASVVPASVVWLPIGVGVLAYVTAVWAQVRVRRSLLTEVPANVLSVGSWRQQEKSMLWTAATVVVVVLLTLLGWESAAVAVGVMTAAPVALVLLSLPANPRAEEQLRFPGRIAIAAANASMATAAGLLAWGPGSGWGMAGGLLLMLSSVFWAVGRRQNARAGSGWRASNQPGS
ncbi:MULTISPECIES: tetratricopeptide repeat protein [Actinoalloteichus]|uniref:Tetratricopeptide repeat n=1 Tax=Actinoalloteichus fjordicus TaxID=1612552 RepID=A0AAC9LFN4_9PSEU|nr:MULTISPECIES: tetratricopeptide repeat protein [Actinoalloteichus]APU16511.1 Tetratricopeptide repeat [Actinoalloteichus fjordicus]APU22579.1 Tetratricopeptide repeat [Actinoalloteichus sp. GBA129-24]